MARYLELRLWHRRNGSTLEPPPWRPPARSRRVAADDPDPTYTKWLVSIVDYLVRLGKESEQQLARLAKQPQLLRAVADKVDQFWFQADKLNRLVDARQQAVDQLDTISSALSTNLAISNEYLASVLETADRAQSTEAKNALVQLLDLTHADEATA